METSTIQQNEEFRFWLHSELMNRCRRNPRYSLRSFALLLEMDASSISQIMSGKRKASVKVITKICQRLSVDPRLEQKFLSKLNKKKPAESSEKNYELLHDDAIEVISNWLHFAVLEIMNLDHFQSSPAWMANKLSVTAAEIKMVLERLERLELIESVNGVYKRTENFLSTYKPGQTSAAQKEMQRQVLKMALNAIDDVPVIERDMTNMTMAIDPDKLPEARKMITKFRRELCAFLEDGERTRVYQLGIQVYPLTKE